MLQERETGLFTVEHADLRRRLWPSLITLDKKLYGHTEDLKITAEFIV
jgi:hypothetical protein